MANFSVCESVLLSDGLWTTRAIPQLPVELTLHPGQSCPKDRLSYPHLTWLHYLGPLETDTDKWSQVQISSGLIGLAFEVAFLKQQKTGILTQGFYLEKASEQLGLGWARLCRGVGHISRASLLVASLEPGHSRPAWRLPWISWRDKESRGLPGGTPFPWRRLKLANWSPRKEK